MNKKKKAEEKTLQPKARVRKLLSDPNVPTYYSNTVEIATSGSDFRIRIGEILEASAEEILVKHRATLYFSPRHAKEVALLFEKKVKEHENKYGKITPTE